MSESEEDATLRTIQKLLKEVLHETNLILALMDALSLKRIKERNGSGENVTTK